MHDSPVPHGFMIRQPAFGSLCAVSAELLGCYDGQEGQDRLDRFGDEQQIDQNPFAT